MDRSDLAIVIAAYREEKTIGHVVRGAFRFGCPIVVDDCSSDRTSEVARAAGAHVVRHQTNCGYDGALNSGFAAAAQLNFRFVLTMDGDGQHDSELIPAFTQKLAEGADLVVGIRPHPARFAEFIFGVYARLRFGLRDPLCGMKAYRMSVYRERGWFDSYQSIGTELALFAVKHGKRIAQLSIPIADRQDAPRFAGRYRANLRIFRAMYLSLRHI